MHKQSTCYYNHWIDTGLLIAEGIIRQVVAYMGYYIYYYWNLQILNNVIIIRSKVLLPQTEVTLADFGYPF
jgi:hypothetical protein